MAFNVSSLTDYTEKAREIFQDEVLLSEDYQRYELQEGIKYQEYLNYIDTTVYAQSDLCGLENSGTTTFTEKTITVVPVAYKKRFCEGDLRKKALPQVKGTGLDKFAPPVEVALTKSILDGIKDDYQKDLWAGNGSGNYDGWIDQISGCSGAISLDSYSGVTPTVSNIDEIVGDFIDNITNKIWARAKTEGFLTLHCSKANYVLYKRNRLAANYYRDQNDNSLLSNDEMWLYGFEGQISIKAEPGLGTFNHMILTWDKNLVRGIDEVNEVAVAKWIFDETTDYIWFKNYFKSGTQVKKCDEVIHNMY